MRRLEKYNVNIDHPHPFSGLLLEWYRDNARTLPWRETKDPFKIWLSEIILQQTRVQQGLPYYQKFLQNFSNVVELADASEQEVLSLWQGLGYYSRARNLHACSRQIRDEYGGIFPNSYQELLKLKGIGPYTAAAIASFCYMESVPVVDGNVFRVASRYLGIDLDIAQASSRKVFENAVANLMKGSPPDQFNQAIMEFGALQCVPGLPDCQSCSLQNSCFAFQHKQQRSLPVKLKKLKVKDRYFHYILVQSGDQVLMRERTAGDIWQGLHDFLLIESEHPLTLGDIRNQRKLEEMGIQGHKILDADFVVKHVLTHQRLHCKFYLYHCEKAELSDIQKNAKCKSLNIKELEHVAKPILIDKFLKVYIN